MSIRYHIAHIKVAKAIIITNEEVFALRKSELTSCMPRKEAVICWNGTNTEFILAHYGMFSRNQIWIMLTTK